LTLHGEITDPEFLQFFETIGRERLATFGTEDVLVVDLVHREQPIPEMLRARMGPLLEQGILERVGRGRGTQLLLSRRFYGHLGQPGVYTRRHGLDHETNKALLVKHIQDSSAAGARMAELQQVLPALSRMQIKGLLQELARAKAIHVRGRTRNARWYPGSERRDWSVTEGNEPIDDQSNLIQNE
jgi:ATP-dependent DNA helicase RecG